MTAKISMNVTLKEYAHVTLVKVDVSILLDLINACVTTVTNSIL